MSRRESALVAGKRMAPTLGWLGGEDSASASVDRFDDDHIEAVSVELAWREYSAEWVARVVVLLDCRGFLEAKIRCAKASPDEAMERVISTVDDVTFNGLVSLGSVISPRRTP